VIGIPLTIINHTKLSIKISGFLFFCNFILINYFFRTPPTRTTMKQFFKNPPFSNPAKEFHNLKISLIFLFFISALFGCKKQDILPENHLPSKDITSTSFLQHSNSLGPSVERVLLDIKTKMNERQVNAFIKKAGLINWDKSVAYASAGLKNIASRQEIEADSIVVLPVALPDADNVNAALVAKIYHGGDSIVYSTHFKNHFSSIDSIALPQYNMTARELYVLGMIQLDAEVFSHKKFIISDHHLNFNQTVNARVGGSGIASVSITLGDCEYNFTYSSSVVFPPVTIYSYSAPCGSPILLPPAAFLNDLDESYGFVYYSSTPVGEGGGGGPASPYQLEFSNFFNSLNTNQHDFLDNQEYSEYYNGFVDYLILNQYSQASKDHIVWCINYLTSPTTLITTFSEFASLYLNDFPSLSFLSQDDINWLNNYPYLQSRIYYYLQNTIALNMEEKIQFHIDKLRTESSYFTFNTAYSTLPQYKNLWFSDESYMYKFGGLPFGEWAINYLMQNTAVPFENFQEEYLPDGPATLTSVDVSAINDPCLLELIQFIGVAGHKSYILNAYFNQEINNGGLLKKYKVKYLSNTGLIGSNGQPVPGHTDVYELTDGTFEIEITLNPDFFQNTTKEWVTTVILHELLHGIITSVRPDLNTNKLQHKFMFDREFPVSIAQSLIELFPNIDLHDALALGIDGLSEGYLIEGTNTIDPAKDIFAQEKYSQNLNQAISAATNYRDAVAGYGTSFC
jgi:hypothetical protein